MRRAAMAMCIIVVIVMVAVCIGVLVIALFAMENQEIDPERIKRRDEDTGQNGKFGDEAETVTTITYDLGGITLVGKATDQEETEVSAAFTF